MGIKVRFPVDMWINAVDKVALRQKMWKEGLHNN